MSTYNYAPGAVHLDIHHNNISTSATQIAELIHSFTSDRQTAETEKQAEDVTPVDTSFFCTNSFTSDIIEKNLRQAIESASSKADACRRIMALEPLGYLLLSNVTDERKAELINPFATPKYIFKGEDFRDISRWVRRHKLKHAAISIFTPEMSSELFEEYRSRLVTRDP